MIRPSVGCLVAFCLVLAGCKIEPPKPPLVQTVAVLPFDSEANNINAPDIMQKLVYEALKGCAYQVSDLEAVNKKLAEAGIVDGGQLAIADPVKLGKDLGVQGLLYGNVASFGYTNIGFYSQRKVSLELKMVDVGTGQTLWENTGNGVTRNVTLDSEQAKKNFTGQLAQQAIEKALKNPLAEESRLATLQALRTLPGFSFHGFESDKKGSNQFRSGSEGILKSLIKK